MREHTRKTAVVGRVACSPRSQFSSLALIPTGSSLPILQGAALALASVALLAGCALLVFRLRRRRTEADAASIAAVTSCFESLAARSGLALVRATPYPHPLVGPIAMYPSLRGTIDGYDVSITIEANPRDDEEERTVLRVLPRAGSFDWSAATNDAELRQSAFRGAAAEVHVRRGELVAFPSAEARIDSTGHARRIETDPARLATWLGLAVGWVRSMDGRD